MREQEQDDTKLKYQLDRDDLEFRNCSLEVREVAVIHMEQEQNERQKVQDERQKEQDNRGKEQDVREQEQDDRKLKQYLETSL